MSDTTQLKREDVKNEVKRIKKLPPKQREEQFQVFLKRVSDDIESTCVRIDNDQHSAGIKRKEGRRLLYCVMAFPKDYRKSVYEIWDKAFGKVLQTKDPNEVSNNDKVNAAHISGLPLPEQAEVDIWWQDKKLLLASAATEFSLPVERVMGMGITKDTSAYWASGDKTYLTIEYKKEDDIKSIVIRARWKTDFNHLIRYFDKIKGTREINKQEL